MLTSFSRNTECKIKRKKLQVSCKGWDIYSLPQYFPWLLSSLLCGNCLCYWQGSLPSVGDSFSRDQCTLVVSLVALQEPVDPPGSSWAFSLCLTQVLKILEMFAILLLAHFILMRNAFPRSFCLVCPCSLYGAAWVARKKKKIPEKWDLGAEAKRKSFKGSWQPEFFGLNCWFFLHGFFLCFVSRQNMFKGVDYWKPWVQC